MEQRIVKRLPPVASIAEFEVALLEEKGHSPLVMLLEDVKSIRFASHHDSF